MTQEEFLNILKREQLDEALKHMNRAGHAFLENDPFYDKWEDCMKEIADKAISTIPEFTEFDDQRFQDMVSNTFDNQEYNHLKFEP